MLIGTNISCIRAGRELFSDLSFSLSSCEQLVIRGANGSGKSTLLRMLAGLIPPKKDTLFWKAKSISRQNLHAYQQNLLYRGHSLSLHLEARVEDQMRLWQKLYKIPHQDIEQALAHWGVEHMEHKKIYQLSQGQQKRLSLSQCHWLKRSLWILDEPDAGLDSEGQQLLAEACAAHLTQGGGIVIATHKMVHGCGEIVLR